MAESEAYFAASPSVTMPSCRSPRGRMRGEHWRPPPDDVCPAERRPGTPIGPPPQPPHGSSSLHGQVPGPLRLRNTPPREVPEKALNQRLEGRPNRLRLGEQRHRFPAPCGDRPDPFDGRTPFPPGQLSVVVPPRRRVGENLVRLSDLLESTRTTRPCHVGMERPHEVPVLPGTAHEFPVDFQIATPRGSDSSPSGPSPPSPAAHFGIWIR